MRLLFALVLVVLAAPASARANDVMLWACHGPDGRSVPAAYDSVRSAGTYVTASTPCDTVRVGFTDPAPPEGSSAVLRLNAPTGMPITAVWLDRDVIGPGYFARTSTVELETLETDQTLSGIFTRAASGSWVELGMRCASAGCDASGRLDFRRAALVVQDATSPTFTLSGVPPYATGLTEMVVDARDTGLGLARATATVDGVPLAAAALGGTACTELSPGDSTVDLPLAEDCPAARRIALALDSTAVPDGTHRLEVTVTDGAGNAAVQSLALKVVNHPPVTPTPTPTPVPTATPTPTPVPSTPVLGALGRYRAGAVAVAASCPARAATGCRVALTLKAKVPPSRRTTTIGRAHATVEPGAKATLKLKLSAAARRALKKRHSLRATLTLAGAKPVAVTVRRG